jgi:hypothetical protein
MKTLELEQARSRLAERLAGPASAHEKLTFIVRFFGSAAPHFGADALRSYHLEFSSPFLKAASGAAFANRPPEFLQDVLGWIRVYRERFAAETSTADLDRAERAAAFALLETAIVLGEWESGLGTLETLSGERIPAEIRDAAVSASADPAETCRKLADAMSVRCPAAAGVLQAIAGRWAAEYGSQAEDRLWLLFSQKSADGEQAASERDCGLLVSAALRTRVRLHPNAADDTIRLNNDWVSRTEPFHRLIRGALAVMRPVLAKTGYAAPSDRHGHFIFALSDREAAFVGRSLEAPLALLAAGGLVNGFYGRPLVLFPNDTAVTGGVDGEGRILPVDADGLKAKLRAAFFSPLRRVVVPWPNLQEAVSVIEELRLAHPNRKLDLQSADTLEALWNDRNVAAAGPVTAVVRLTAGLRRNRVRIAWSAASAGILLILALLLLPLLFRDRNPASIDISGSVLVAKSAGGRELWKHDFGVPLTRSRYADPSLRVRVTDVDGDGRAEVLFGVYESANLGEMNGSIYLFGPDGKIRLRLKTGRAMPFGGEPYEDHYRVAFVDARDLDGDGRGEIVSIAFHFPDYPCCVNVWSLSGEKLGEYWHSGQLEKAEYIDADRDGVLELFLTGQNNEYRCAVLAVLKPPRLTGASPQTPGGHYAADGLGTGGEMQYIRFPKSVLSELAHNRDSALHAEEHGGRIRVGLVNTAASTDGRLSHFIYYIFDLRFRLLDVDVGDCYFSRVFELRGRPLTDSELFRPVLRFDGSGWLEMEKPRAGAQ